MLNASILPYHELQSTQWYTVQVYYKYTILLQYSVRVRSVLLHSPIPTTLYAMHSFRCVLCVALRFCRPNVIIQLYIISPAVLIYL